MVISSLARRKLVEHLSSILVVAAVLGAAVIFLDAPARDADSSAGFPFSIADSLDLSSSLDRAIVRDMSAASYRNGEQAGDSILSLLDQHKRALFLDPERKTGGGRQRVSLSTALNLVPPYAVFLLLYTVLFVVTTLAARSVGTFRFIREKQGRRSQVRLALLEAGSGNTGSLKRSLAHALIALFRGVVLLILFCPAYIAAYAVRTKLDTQNIVFVIILGVISNGLLIAYASKFSTYLMNESRRGYVEAAVVKGLRSDFTLGTEEGLPWSVLWSPVAGSHGHVFSHIYQNAAVQFLPSIKEHATFLVTSLAIVEMALNLNGHLCYRLLQHLLQREFGLVLLIMFGIFVTVKAVEIVVDVAHAARERRGYDA
jgi:hypothetical protein